MQKWILGAAGAVLVIIAALFVTSSAILVKSDGPSFHGGGKQESLVCSYFTGLGFLEQEFWYSPNGIMGRAACPRFISF